MITKIGETTISYLRRPFLPLCLSAFLPRLFGFLLVFLWPIYQVHRARSQRHRLPDDDVLRHTAEMVLLADDAGPEQVVRRDFERGPGEDRGLAPRYSVTPDGLDIPVARHHVRHEHDMAYVHVQALL